MYEKRIKKKQNTQPFKQFRNHIVNMASLAPTFTVASFHRDLSTNEFVDIYSGDFPDPDNFVALRTLVAQRKKAGAKGPLHAVMVGAPFSSSTAPAVADPATKLLSFKMPDGTSVECDGKTFGAPYVKESFGEPRNEEEERMLFEINIARFRAMLKASGADPDSVIFYNGGVTDLRGISYRAAVQEWKGLKNCSQDIMETPTFEGEVFELATADELERFKRVWATWTVEERSAYFKASHFSICDRGASATLDVAVEGASSCKKPRLSLSPEVHALVDLASSGARFRIFCGAPPTGLVKLPKEVRDKVEYIAAMSGCISGKKNLFGANFNNVTAFEASQRFLGTAYPNVTSSAHVVPSAFPNARILLQPTDSFKTDQGVFTLDASAIAALEPESADLRFLASLVEQWTLLNPRKQTQPLFDVAVLLPLPDLVRLCKVFPAVVVFGPNEGGKDTPFEHCGLKITYSGEEAQWLTEDSGFPIGIYSLAAFGKDGVEGGNFENGAKELLPDLFRSVFAP
jgi:hypothetical protein